MATAPSHQYKVKFQMPLIAPPPDGYAPSVEDYYNQIKIDLGADYISTTQTVIAAVQTYNDAQPNPSTTLPKDALYIEVNAPNEFPLSDKSRPPLKTLFATLGGWITYHPAQIGGAPNPINSILPPPFDTLAPALHHPTPTGMTLQSHGVIVLDFWGPDVKRLLDAAPGTTLPTRVYYFYVDQGSLQAILKPAVEAVYSKTSFDAATADGDTPALQTFLEKVNGSTYGGTPSYSDLVAEVLNRVTDHGLPLHVSGGTAIGSAATAAVGGKDVCVTELWFANPDTSAVFIAPGELLERSILYDF